MERAISTHHRPIEAAWRSIVVRTFFFLLILSNLLYSLVAPEWREEGVVALAIVALLFFAVLMQRSLFVSNLGEIVVVLMFASLAVAQQYFLANGNLDVSIKWALTFVATFVPYWIARSMGRTGTVDLERVVAYGLAALLIVTATSISVSYVFDKGEVYVQPSGLTRAFGWLGDSFPPVLVFFVFYYFFRKQYVVATLSLMVLLMTVAKSALLMLILSPVVFVFSAASARTKIALCACYVASLLGLIAFAAPIFEKMGNLFQADYSYYTRALSIYSGIDYFISAPLTGIGINQSLSLIEGDAHEHAGNLGIGTYFNVLHIDNSIIKVAAETGLPGLVLLLTLLYFMLRGAFRTLRGGKEIANPRERAVVLASSLWVIGFILFYQTTAWFDAGHPQLAWLLLFVVLADVFCRRAEIRMLLSGRVVYTDRTAQVGPR